MKIFTSIAAAAVIGAVAIGTRPALATTRNCPNVDFYQQPNSAGKKRIGSLGDPSDLDIINVIVERNGQKWYQFRFFNGRPGQTGAGWIYGWLMESQICKG